MQVKNATEVLNRTGARRKLDALVPWCLGLSRVISTTEVPRCGMIDVTANAEQVDYPLGRRVSTCSPHLNEFRCTSKLQQIRLDIGSPAVAVCGDTLLFSYHNWGFCSVPRTEFVSDRACLDDRAPSLPLFTHSHLHLDLEATLFVPVQLCIAL